ncbi:uncharacterized protein PHACADRAFT_191439 [Phanerochaete carnosa HHB-10118-sp]|uniref:Actin cytoskeleton-regulatory complex protein SLA1 n=1 Tax=Phanerochaete carnosa (strain HHB-10118-sp) TaxID=650164 RepID=K5V8I2_PHACS|nr:uncharacterized protein PHACADRAFT_191439 [Phanerochaete carnosa HHB-10118-sp]EKM59126.1 hypothetical protein PHACADRAFT_191439 [Phanerochaete carnosa HHB-10118-sp]
MSSDPEDYLAVLKAAYDYEPQADAEDELAVKENQLLFLLERTDDEWWKVKVKADMQDEDGPSGLIPAAYVEPAERISVVKVLYEYEAQQPGELSVGEDEVLYVYDKDEDWLLVHSQKEGGKVGYVPGNYVEEVPEEGESTPQAVASPPAVDLSKLVIPDSPPKPAYTDPAELVNKSKAKAQAGPVETWSVSEVDKKGKKKKGTLGVGNGAMFFASESDKTPVQKWQTSDILTTRIEKNKHVHIDIGGISPISLHFHAGSKDIADTILNKLQEARLPLEAQETTLAVEPPERPRSSAQKSVHFDNAAPVIIPPREDDGQSEPDEDGGEYGEEPDGPRAAVLYDFHADEEDEMSVSEGETLLVLKRDTDEWWKCRNARGQEGVLVPGTEGAGRSSTDSDASEAQAARATAERAESERREREEAERKERERKKEAEQRAKAAAAQAEADRRRREQERERQREKEKERERVADEEARRKARDSMETPRSPKANGSGSRSSAEKRPPPTANVRTWHDRTGQFRVDAAFLGFASGKLRLHKVNGVVIEVPSDKMSADDMKYVERAMAKQREQQRGSSPRGTSDDEPLEHRRRSLQPSAKTAQSSKKGPTVDWFEFFLSAGCDIDDCTRYAASFERDKIDEAILPDITESTMRSLGLREGDIIRVKKAIDARKPKPTEDVKADQLRRDEELAKQLQAQENGGTPRGEAPNLFAAGPNGALKNNVRRGRPQPSKSVPSTVDINAISSASDQIQRTGTPSRASGTPTPQLPERSNSVSLAPTPSGFDDDAWTVRPSSTTPIAPSSPANNRAAPTPPVAPPAPPVQVAAPAPAPAPAPPAAAPPAAPAPPPAPPAPSASAPPATTPAAPIQQPGMTGSSLAKKTEADVFDQLARLNVLRLQNPVITQRPASALSSGVTSPPPLSFQSGLGMGSSPAPLAQHLQAQRTGILAPPQPINGPRGPLAPVPANQALLQPLIPTNTGFNSFVPARPQSTPSYLQPQQTGILGPPPQPLLSQPTGFQAPPPPSFRPPQMTGLQGPQPTGFQGLQPTGFQGSQPVGFQPSPQPFLSQPTGFQPSGPMLSQPTGIGGNFGGISSFQNPSGSFGQVQPNPTGFNPGFGQFNATSPPPAPQPPASNQVNTNPANIFAQMKSGTFGQDDSLQPQSADKYDSLRPQPTGWGGGYQGMNGFSGGYGFQ